MELYQNKIELSCERPTRAKYLNDAILAGNKK